MATTKIIGHGTVPAFMVPVSSSTVSTAVAMISSHGTMPVKKKSNALPPVAENPATSTVIQSEEPADQEEHAAADDQPVGRLELAQIHVCSFGRRCLTIRP